MIRENRIEDALKFASEQLAERGEEDATVLSELERTLALLAFEDPHLSPFSDLLSHSHRQKVSTTAKFYITYLADPTISYFSKSGFFKSCSFLPRALF